MDFFSSIHSFNQGSYLSNCKNQCFVSFKTGLLPLIADFGLINSVGLNEVPHFSHWSPYAPSLLHEGHSPVIYLSDKN